MKLNPKKVLTIFLYLSLLPASWFFLSKAFAAGVSNVKGTANVVNTNNSIYFNSPTYNSNVIVSDPDPEDNNKRTLSGFAWSTDLGWIKFTSGETAGVTVTYADGDLTGQAYVMNTQGVLDFDSNNANARINTTTGKFEGYAWSQDIGWVNMGNSGAYVEEKGKPNNPTVINGYDTSEKELQISSDATHYRKYSEPYFEWLGATDTADESEYTSGVAGYYVYWGTNATAIPSASGTYQTQDTYTATELVSGNTYYLRIQAVDAAGNIHTDVAEEYTFFTYLFDGDAPINPTGISAPQTYQSTINGITIYWSNTGSTAATDEVSLVKGYQYKIGDNGTWYGESHTGAGDCTDLLTGDSYTLNDEFDHLVMGENTLYFRTYDNACNVSPTPVTSVLKYSGIAPSEPRSLSVTPTSNTENSFSFTWQKPLTYSGQENGISYCYTVNTLPSANICNWVNDTTLPADAYATLPTTNTFYVVAKDEAGNINYSSYAHITFNADTPAPSIPRNIEISDVSIKATSSWKLVIAWEVPSNVGVGIKTYQIHHSLDGSSFSQIATTGDKSYVNAGIEQRVHYYKVRACDSANNCSAYTSVVQLYPDGRYTSAPLLISNPVVSNTTTRKATISWVTDRESDTRIQYGKKSGVYFEEEVGNSNMVKQHSIVLNNLEAETLYYFKAKWVDEDGNVGSSNEILFKTEPMPSVISSKVSKVGLDFAIIDVKIKGADKAQILYGKSITYESLKEVNASPITSSYSIIISGLTDGIKYHYKIKLFDSEGYGYDSIEDHTFTTPPKPKISDVRIEEVKGVASPTVEFTWETNTKTTSIVTFQKENEKVALDKVDIKMIDGQHKMSISGLVPKTTYIATVEGIDNMGNKAVSEKVTFTTSTDTRPPKLSNIRVIGDLISRSVQKDKSRSAQIIVTWETDEPSTSQVKYGEGSGGDFLNSTSIEVEYRTKHSIIIGSLIPSKVYHINLLSEDSAGNVGESGSIISITPKSNDTVFESVMKSFSSVFRFIK